MEHTYKLIDDDMQQILNRLDELFARLEDLKKLYTKEINREHDCNCIMNELW